LDYVTGKVGFKDIFGERHDLETSERMHKALFALKCSAVYTMLKNKRDTKLQNLKQILQEFIKKKNKQKEQQRVLKRELQALPLDKRLEQLISEDSILTAP